jgi:hypothetical protein
MHNYVYLLFFPGIIDFFTPYLEGNKDLGFLCMLLSCSTVPLLNSSVAAENRRLATVFCAFSLFLSYLRRL